jgi:hypothetical protein
MLGGDGLIGPAQRPGVPGHDSPAQAAEKKDVP